MLPLKTSLTESNIKVSCNWVFYKSLLFCECVEAFMENIYIMRLHPNIAFLKHFLLQFHKNIHLNVFFKHIGYNIYVDFLESQDSKVCSIKKFGKSYFIYILLLWLRIRKKNL